MDVKKLAYDLALIYTKTQYDQALSQGTIPVALKHPQILEDEAYLTKTFSDMYIDLLNSPGLFSDIEEWEPKLLGKNE